MTRHIKTHIMILCLNKQRKLLVLIDINKKDKKEKSSRLYKILQSSASFCKILQGSSRFYKIL